MRWLSRLHREWTKNDGKPWEEWGAGRDLKEIVLIAVAAVLTVVQIGAVAWSLLP